MMIGRFTYGPYGQHYCQTGLAPLLGFNGRRYDPVALTYALGMGYRSYSPTLMRFQGPDDLSPFAEGGLNAYAYCKNDPVNYRDDTGQAPTLAQLKAGRNRLKSVSTIQKERQKAPPFKQQKPQAAEPVFKTSRKKKTVNFAEGTVFEGQLPAHRKDYQARKTLTNKMSRLLTLSESIQSELNILWAPVTRQNYRTHNLYAAYQRRLTSVSHALQEVMMEKERIQQRLQETRW